MDRLNALHLNARVELFGAMKTAERPSSRSRFSLRPMTYLYVGVFGFACCSAAVIATASFVALQIQ